MTYSIRVKNWARAFAAAVMLYPLVGCGTKVTMMPTPVLFQGGRINLYESVPQELQTNTLDVFYATDRSPKGSADDRDYGNGVEEKLRLGKATVQFGDNGNWTDLVNASLASPRANDVVMKRTRAMEMGVLSSDPVPKDAAQLNPGERAFA